MKGYNMLSPIDVAENTDTMYTLSEIAKMGATGTFSTVPFSYYGMFLAIIIPPARKDKVVAVLVAISFALSFACNYLPGISALSDGTRTILLTVLISSAAAVLFPVKDQEAEHDA